jgi:putative polyketide hydroxylase
VLMHTDLTPWVADRPAALYFIEQPGLRATFLTINGVNRWGFLINSSPEEHSQPHQGDLSEHDTRDSS